MQFYQNYLDRSRNKHTQWGYWVLVVLLQKQTDKHTTLYILHCVNFVSSALYELCILVLSSDDFQLDYVYWLLIPWVASRVQP